MKFFILKSLYLNGNFFNIDGKLDINISSYGNESLTKIIKAVIGNVLQQVYSSNKFICPDESLGLTDNVTNKFLNNYILGGKTDPTGIDVSIIKNIVKNLEKPILK